MAEPPLPERRKSNTQNPLSLNYHHGEMRSIEEVKSLMINYLGKDGAFIIRNSFSKPGCLTVSVMHDNGIKHFNLAKTATEFYVQDVKFATIEALVEYYSKHDVPNQEGIKHVRLKYPIINQKSIMRQPSPRIAHSVSSNDTPPLMRSFSTLPSSVNRQGSMSSLSSVNSELSRRNTVATNSEPKLPIQKGVGAASSQTSPKHRKTFLDKFLPSPLRHKRRVVSASSDMPPSSDQDESGSVSSRGRTQSESSIKIDDRPQLPLPDIPVAKKSDNLTEVPQYDQVRDVEQNRASDLILTLERAEQYSSSALNQCECGLSFDESELPRGWSMHISRERQTYGRLFFMGPNKETAWNPPFEVSLELSADQQDRIRDLMTGAPVPQAQDMRQGGAVNESLPTASMPSSPAERSNISASIHQLQQVTFELQGREEVDGGTSSFHQVHRSPQQHNEHTGSTEASQPC